MSDIKTICAGEGCDKVTPPGDNKYCHVCGMKIQLEANVEDRKRLIQEIDELKKETEKLNWELSNRCSACK